MTKPSDDKSDTNSLTKAPKPRGRFGVYLPFLIFAAIAGLFFLALKAGDPSHLPSALIGKPMPQFELLPLETATGSSGEQEKVTSEELGKGKPALVHFFASWCAPCREEHPAVMALAEQLRAEDPGVAFVGINYKDDPNAARRFLGGYGNPYTHIGVDRTGRTAINFGVYGVPETYVVSGDGTVAFRQAGPLSEEIVKTKILPLLRNDPPPPETSQTKDGAQTPSG